MIGIILFTHGSFSKEIIKTAELITGPSKDVVTLSLNRSDNIENLNLQLQKSIEEFSGCDGVLVLTDLFGGSPSNLAFVNIKKYKYKAVTGLNLPMLLEALTLRDSLSIDELAERCYQAGIEGIKKINDLLNNN